jgi:two-component system response regulator VanR
MMKRILLVEDELALLHIEEAFFKKAGFDVVTATDGLSALTLFQQHTFDIACIDVMLPHIDGFDVVKSIRQHSKLPIIMVTALSSEENQLKGYNLEIDDYVTKPFSPSVLVAKVESVLRRNHQISMNDSAPDYTIGRLRIHFDKRQTWVDDNLVSLSKKEFDMLSYLLKHPGIAVDRSTFLDEVWGMDVFVEDRIVDTFIKQMRQKLGPAGQYIQTVRGIGYRFGIEE